LQIGLKKSKFSSMKTTILALMFGLITSNLAYASAQDSQCTSANTSFGSLAAPDQTALMSALAQRLNGCLKQKDLKNLAILNKTSESLDKTVLITDLMSALDQLQVKISKASGNGLTVTIKSRTNESSMTKSYAYMAVAEVENGGKQVCSVTSELVKEIK
jgi:hypothetical protein